MALASNRLVSAVWHVLPAPARRKLRGNTGIRFTRFMLVAIASVAASQVALSIFIGPAHMTAGLSGGLAAIIGAGVSYVLSRWAWERKGKPQLLKETLPFWLVSVGAWIILGLAAKLGVYLAESAEYDGAVRVLITDGTYLAANCVTFLARFVIFHYVLFADPRSARLPVEPPMSSSSEAAGAPDEAEPFAMVPDAGPRERADETMPDLR
jgi:putative flippase GtrA